MACQFSNSSEVVTHRLIDHLYAQVRHLVATYTRDNMAVVNMFIREPYVKKYLTEEKMRDIICWHS